MPNTQQRHTAAQALQFLKEGNARFIQGLRSVESMMRSQDLAELAEKGQTPFVILVSCADSRVPAEILFDRGPGDIFVCRVAGNIITPAMLGSIEFAAQQFGTPLCLVMGHTRCGAIKATLQSTIAPPSASSGTSPNLLTIVKEIEPAALETKARYKNLADPQELARCTDEAAYVNVQHSLNVMMEKSEVIRGLVQAGKLQLAGAVCDISSGKVDFMKDAGAKLQAPLSQTRREASV